MIPFHGATLSRRRKEHIMRLPVGLYHPRYRNREGQLCRSAKIWIRYTIGGKRYHESSHSTSVAVARRLREQRLGQAALGQAVGPDITKTTFADIRAMLIDDYKANGRRSLDRAEDAIAHVAEFFDGWRIVNMTTDAITRYTRQRQEVRAANATINYELALLKRGLRLGFRARRVGVLPYVAMLQLDNARKGFFEREELDALLAQLPEGSMKAAVLVGYITGWRMRSEILTRQRHHVDLDAGWLRLEPGQSKNGEGRMFPLTPELREVLAQQIERVRAQERTLGQVIPWLFPGPDGARLQSFRRRWLTACKTAGLADRIPHDFRRTAVRNLERASVPRSAAMKMVGHKTESVYRRYAIVDEGMLREGAAKLAALHEAQRKQAKPKVAVLR
jgi:integrase